VRLPTALARRPAALPRHRAALAPLCTVLALSVTSALALGGTARAGDECRGLAVCIAVTGPWVVVPAATGPGAATPTYYEVRCPRRSMIVAGLDADLGDRRIALEFFGALGGPIGPGVTTADRVVFAATFTGSARRPTSFRPRIGCVPTAGGGRETTSAGGPSARRAGSPSGPLAVRPSPLLAVGPSPLLAVGPSPLLAAPPPLRRVRTVRLGGIPTGPLAHHCREGERLVSSSAALGLRRSTPPGVALMQTISLTRRVAGTEILVFVDVEGPLPSRAEVQIHAVCARR